MIEDSLMLSTGALLLVCLFIGVQLLKLRREAKRAYSNADLHERIAAQNIELYRVAIQLRHEVTEKYDNLYHSYRRNLFELYDTRAQLHLAQQQQQQTGRRYKADPDVKRKYAKRPTRTRQHWTKRK